jgi:DNA-binding LacI/PurR family transcriptional regulator
MSTTLKDIARACGKDISTVSRALRDDPQVKAATRQRIQALAEGLGYRPNLAARALVAGRSRTIWFLMPSLRSTLEQVPAHYASVYLGEQGYDLMAALHRDDEQVYRRQLARLTQGMADGALIIPNTGLDDQGLVRSLLRRGFPLVFIDRYPQGVARAHRVINGNAEASRQMLRRLATAGARQVISLFGDGNNAEQARREGLLTMAAELGLALGEHRLPRAAAKGGATAILATGQHQILAFLQAHPALVRRDLLFGCFDQWIGEPHPAQAVVVAKQDFEGMARQACDRLLALVGGAQPDDPQIVVPALSCDWIEPRF